MGKEGREVLLEKMVYVIRDAVNHPRGIVGRSWRRPCGERPAVAAVACHFSDGVAEGPLALNDLLGHDGGARAGGGQRYSEYDLGLIRRLR